MTAIITIATDLTTATTQTSTAKRVTNRKSPLQGKRLDGAAASAAGKKIAANESKSDLVLKKLRTPKGATVAQLIEATGWQAHTVRGFLSGTVRKKLGLTLTSDVGKDGVRRYRVADRSVAG